MNFQPIPYTDVFIDQEHIEAMQVLNNNNIEWIYQSTIFDHKLNQSKKFDIGFFKDFGLIEIQSKNNKISHIKLYLNWYDNNQKFTGYSFEINEHYSFPNGQGELYRACKIETASLFTAIEEIQANGHTAFPFHSLNFTTPLKIFPHYIQDNVSNFNATGMTLTTDYFLSVINPEHREVLGDPLSEKYKTNYNSFSYKQWNDLNAGNKKYLNVFTWNNLDQQFNIEIGNILRIYDESFHDDKKMDAIKKFITSPLFTHKMECGLNITHVIALIQYQPLHEIIYNQFTALLIETQFNLINTSDQMGLTLPLLFIHSQLRLNGHQYQYAFLLEKFRTYSYLPGFNDSLTTSKSSLLDTINFNNQFLDIFNIVDNSGYKITDNFHVKNNLFSENYRYDYQINGQHNIIEYLNNINNITVLHSNKHLAKFIHTYWLEEKTASYMIDKKYDSKKMKI